VDKEGGIKMDDAAGFFANVFGGERFRDYVSAILYPSNKVLDALQPPEIDRRNIPHEGYDIRSNNDAERGLR
jgi:hypothetical protein